MRYLVYLNLDVAAGAVVMAAYFCKLGGSCLPVAAAVALFCAIWATYTTDRLLDNQAAHAPPTQRHRFHRQHRHLLKYFIVAATAIGALCTAWLPAQQLVAGAALAAISVLYLLLVQWLPAFASAKELAVAAIYTAGVSLPVWSGQLLNKPVAFALVATFSCALLNLLLLSKVDAETEKQAGSLVQRLAPSKYSQLWWALFFFGAVATTMGTIVQGQLLVFAPMLLLLAYLWPHPQHLISHRHLADAVFLVPAILLPFQP